MIAFVLERGKIKNKENFNPKNDVIGTCSIYSYEDSNGETLVMDCWENLDEFSRGFFIIVLGF
jgi:hypothetical protein